MKNNKLLLSVVLLTMLTLGACDGQKSNSSSAGSEGTSEPESSSSIHTHSMVFDSFVWTLTVGNYTAQAKYVCSANDGHEEFHDAVMSTPEHVDPLCENDGSTTWKASYDGHEETKVEVLSAIGHQWGEPVWNWTSSLDYAEVTATFTCARNEAHTHVETATKAAGSVVKFEDVPATCTVDGHVSYRATVQFNGQTYTDERVDTIYAEGHPDTDSYGFCEECHEYTGDDIEQYWEPQQISNALSGAVFYYRFVIESGFDYKLVVASPLVASWFSFFGKVSGAWTVINIGTDFSTVTIPDEGEVYMVFENGSSSNVTGTFYIDYTCNHPHGHNQYGFCEDCNEYLGITISSSQWNTEVELPGRDVNEYWYIRVEADDDHHITLYENVAYVEHDAIDEWYYINNMDDVSDLGQISATDFKGIHHGAPTVVKDFFSTIEWPTDGYLYIVLRNVSQDPILDNEYAITASTEHFADEHGYCLLGDDEYLGTSISVAQFTTKQEFSWEKNVPVFFRYEEIYRGHASSSTYEYVEYKFTTVSTGAYQYITVYYMNGGVWKEAVISDTDWCQLPEHPDETNPYIYIVFKYTGSGSHSVSNFTLSYRTGS